VDIINKAELDAWLFDHAQIQGHICSGIKAPLEGVEPGDPPAELFNVAFVDHETGDRFDIVYGDPAASGEE